MGDVIYEVYWEPVCARLWKMLKKCLKSVKKITYHFVKSPAKF